MVVIGIVLKIIIVASVIMGAVAYLIYVERKVAAYAQDRLGPNRAGGEFGVPLGLLQPLDGRKQPAAVVTASEQEAAYAADAYAKTRGYGVVCGTYGVGSMSALNASIRPFSSKLEK